MWAQVLWAWRHALSTDTAQVLGPTDIGTPTHRCVQRFPSHEMRGLASAPTAVPDEQQACARARPAPWRVREL
jgi:hypothetical protein